MLGRTNVRLLSKTLRRRLAEAAKAGLNTGTVEALTRGAEEAEDGSRRRVLMRAEARLDLKPLNDLLNEARKQLDALK